MRAIFLLFMMLIMVPTSFLSPFAGLLIFTWAAYTRPHEWAYVESAQYSLAIVVATLLGYLCFELPRRAPRIVPNLLIVLLWLQLTLSTVMAQSQDTALPKYFEFTKILFLALVTTAMVTTEKRVWWLLLVTLGSIGLIVAKANVSIIIHKGAVKVFGMGGATADNNDFALLLALTIPIIFYFAKAQTNFWLKAAFYSLSVMGVVASLFTYSRGGLLGLTAGVLVLILKSRYKIVSLVVVALIALVTFFALPETLRERFLGIKDARENDASAQQRLRVWEISGDIIKGHPFVGVGIRNILIVRRYAEETDPVLMSHDAYLQMAVDAGLPALALFLGLIGITFWRLRQTRKILRIYAPDSPLIKYAHGMEAGLVGYLVSAIFASRQDLELLYTVIALGTSFILMAREDQKENEIREHVRRNAPVQPSRSLALEPDLDAA